MNKINDLIEKLKENKKIQKILIFSLAIIALIVFIYVGFIYKDDTTQVDNQSETSFVVNLENKLKNTLSKVDGAGKVEVVITVKSGMETVLAMKTTTVETSNGVEIVETPILVNGKTVVLKENYPKVIGVLVVAEGAKNISVLSRIQQATASLLDINVNQIEILTMK